MPSSELKCVALLPLRGGSKSIPLKNLKPIAGKPLFYWSLRAAVDSGCFEEIYVSTDSSEIEAAVHARFPQVQVLQRPAELATDEASTESVMLHFAEHVPFDVLCTLQATSPLTRAEDFQNACREMKRWDSLVTVVEWKRFFWDANGRALNYDPLKRPRRQEFQGSFMENGAFYLTRRALLEKTRCRLGGKIGVHKMAPETALELDDLHDWPAVEAWVAAQKARPLFAESLRKIQVLAVDVDGTLTDGGMYYSESGEEQKKFHSPDGHGLELIRKKGRDVWVITGEDSGAVAARMKKLGIENYLPGSKNKLAALKRFCEQKRVPIENVLYIGDDVNDAEALAACGFSACPSDAHTSVKVTVDYICRLPGGAGAVREICDLLIASV